MESKVLMAIDPPNQEGIDPQMTKPVGHELNLLTRSRNPWTKVEGTAVEMATRNRFRHVTKSFQKQRVMKLLGARICSVSKGIVELSVNSRPALSQQDGFVHAGVLATLLDSAGGYATLSLLPPGSRVLTVEFKINFTRPAVGDAVHARGRVRKLGRTLAVSELEAKIKHDGKWKSCALGSQTVYCIRPKDPNDAPTNGR